MTTVSLSPFSQFRQGFSALGELASSLFDRTDSVFQRVQVTKRDANGQIKQYPVKNDRGETTGNRSVFNYIEHIKTGDLQLDEPMEVVAVKCAGVVFSTPIYVFGKMAWNGINILLQTATISYDAVRKYPEGLGQMGKEVSKIPGVIGDGLFEVVKAPLFGVGMALAGVCGIFRPYHARRAEAIIENAWQGGVSYKEDMRFIPARREEGFWKSLYKDMVSAHPYYHAHCFQIRGNTHESRIQVIRRDPLLGNFPWLNSCQGAHL